MPSVYIIKIEKRSFWEVNEQKKNQTHIAETKIGHTKVWHEFMALLKANHILSVCALDRRQIILDSDINIYIYSFASVWLCARHAITTFDSTILSEPFSSVNW